MGSRLADDYNPVAPYFGDPDDLEPHHMRKAPDDWTEIEESIRLKIQQYCTLNLLDSYNETRKLIAEAHRAWQLKNAKNPEFVRQ